MSPDQIQAGRLYGSASGRTRRVDGFRPCYALRAKFHANGIVQFTTGSGVESECLLENFAKWADRELAAATEGRE